MGLPLMVEIRPARFDEVLTPHYSKQARLRPGRLLPYAGQHAHQLKLDAAATVWERAHRRGDRNFKLLQKSHPISYMSF